MDKMPSGYPAERLSIHDALLKLGLDVANGRPWTIEPKSLRFRHGENIAELKVPFHMGADDEAFIDDAVQSLVALMVKRYSPPSIEGREGPQPILFTVPQIKDKTFRTDLFMSDSLEKRLAAGILSSTPYLDSALLAGWLTGDGHGKKFVKWASVLVEKALKDETRHGGEERTAYLALLSAVNTVKKKKERVKSFRIKGLTYEKIDLAVGMALFTSLRTAVRDTLDKLKDQGAAAYTPLNDALLNSALTPRSFLSIPQSLFANTLNPYGINAEVIELLSGHAQPVSGKAASLDLINSLSEEIRHKSGIMEGLRSILDAARFREEALAYLMEFDIPGSDVQSVLYDVLNEDRLIRNLLNDQKASQNLARALEEIKKRFTKDGRRVECINSLQSFLSSKKSVLGGLLKSSKKELESILPLIEGYCASAFDDHIEGFEGPMRASLADRRGEFNQNMLVEEYNRGRLYRFSVDDRVILKTLATEEEGQLFIDMKDFTRKTLKVKEIAMAEFMNEHFYKPILSAAAQYSAGIGVSSDERGITLTNLPGDAAIFSGGVSYLIALARDIQQIIRRYRDQLAQKLPPMRNEEILDGVHKSFEEKRDALKLRRTELQRALERKEPGVELKLVSLGEEEHRLENTYREEIETAIKGELEAGLYIAYGAKAETTVIEPRGEFSGPVKVAIGEKINEAARGTFRNPMVRAKLELLLENERLKRRQKVKYPFDIYIDRVFSIKMPPELDSAFEKLIGSGKPASAQAMTQIMANEFFIDLKKIIAGEAFTNLRIISSTTDIYNKGQAISVNALEAYMREKKGTKFFFKKTVDPKDLDSAIRDAFFFPVTPLEFWLSTETIKNSERTEAFFKSGEVIFKGFEANIPMVIYEMLNSEGEFFRQIVKYHFHQWLDEARSESQGLLRP
ncbi:MAG: hypothetical protein A2X93_04060 [Deltaproteobacteria bacterium GWC2_56_8]|nr:MAG: hypothetical protein A2X99_06770 [Deltaproteobacteria bacterium GWB2_55_19]OGP37923.1 MAG: hypothetical protein A2X93_04060 [Deltaproteobacteria bacterium GWC2_56_8]HAO94133.1 hypothetical protein [Deltaproteobacteria bacterium]